MPFAMMKFHVVNSLSHNLSHRLIGKIMHVQMQHFFFAKLISESKIKAEKNQITLPS